MEMTREEFYCISRANSTESDEEFTSMLPAVRQVLLDFRFEVASSVTQTARLTEKTRQVTAEWHQELLRGHALHRLNSLATCVLSRLCGGGKTYLVHMCAHMQNLLALAKLEREK